jgi:uncharacterized 2Fe-2S/4Fe-4S cluster protein (DUF4445 family)
MVDRVRIALEPLGQTIQVERGTPLQDLLFRYGVEFPCGGQGRCRGCRVRLIEGSAPVTPEQEEILSPAELAEGWRLACQCSAESPLTLQVAQWETAILTDHAAFSFTPREGWGIAVDLGTTTVVAQLIDLRSGRVLGVRTALNPQARYGADVMSRIQFALASEGHATLVDLIRSKIGSLIRRLVASAECQETPFRSVVVVGNTVMHHLLGGFDLEPLSRWPFETEADGAHEFPASDLGWKLPGDPSVRLLPCLGGFVGSDILAGVLATEMHESDSLVALVDLGTNGGLRRRWDQHGDAGHHGRHHRGECRERGSSLPGPGGRSRSRYLRQRSGRRHRGRAGARNHRAERPLVGRLQPLPAQP